LSPNFTQLDHSYGFTTNNTELASENYQIALKKITPILMRESGPGSVGEARLVCVMQTKVEDGSAPVIPAAPTTTGKPKPTSGAAFVEGRSRAALLPIMIVAVGFSLF
jgi:hypothetical protein